MTVGIGIYTGGDPYPKSGSGPYQGTQTEQLFTLIAKATYTTVVIWAAHVDGSGDISINDSAVVSGGVLNSAAQDWVTQVAALKTNSGTTITRVELSLGGDSTTFANIENLISQYGTGTADPLYTNLQVLQTALNLDAINYDDENQYCLSTSSSLALMCVSLGMKVSICPYEMQDYWVKLVTAINKANPNTVDAIYLQCYGSAEPPSGWNSAFKGTGLTIAAGFWAPHFQGAPPTCTAGTSPSDAQAQITTWAKGTKLDGAWMFTGYSMLNCPVPGTPADYATAICKGLGNADC